MLFSPEGYDNKKRRGVGRKINLLLDQQLVISRVVTPMSVRGLESVGGTENWRCGPRVEWLCETKNVCYRRTLQLRQSDNIL